VVSLGVKIWMCWYCYGFNLVVMKKIFKNIFSVVIFKIF
jgi:hypothetical protein